MNDAFGMRCGQRIGDLNGVVYGRRRIERTLFQYLRERRTLDVFHDEIERRIVLTDVIEAANVRMIQRGNCARFQFESMTEFAPLRQVFANLLDDDYAVQPRIAGQEDLTHAALS